MKAGLASMVYAVDVGGKPTVAFKSESWANARLVSQELWFRIEVGSVTSNDKPVWDCEAELVVRPATAAEIERCWRATEATDKPSDALTYLVEIDPV
jgi:hypothetical protein